jgi:hypothetical protein
MQNNDGRSQSQTCSFADMQLRVGGVMQVETQQQTATRASATLIGWIRDRSVMITAPQNSSGHLVLGDNEPVLCRAFTGRSAFAFQATVLKTLHQPFHYLHLSYPDRVEGVAIRSSPRCRADLPSTITANGKPPLKGTILNIGLSGALVESAEALGNIADPMQIACAFELHGVPVSLDLQATVHSDKSDAAERAERRPRYGVVFGDLQPTQRLMLGAYIWYQIYEDSRNIV